MNELKRVRDEMLDVITKIPQYVNLRAYHLMTNYQIKQVRRCDSRLRVKYDRYTTMLRMTNTDITDSK